MEKIISNEKIDRVKVETASRILMGLQQEVQKYTDQGCGPFLVAIYDAAGNLVIKAANSVVHENNSNAHAEMVAIKLAEEKFGTYDLWYS